MNLTNNQTLNSFSKENKTKNRPCWYEKKGIIASLFFVLSIIPFGIEYLLGTTYATSFTIMLVAYPCAYGIFRINLRSMKCKNLP